MLIFDELKTRGVACVLFICMGGVSGLKEGAKSIFKNVVVQRCIVHLIQEQIKYIYIFCLFGYISLMHSFRIHS